MSHLAMLFAEMPESFGLWMFLSIGAVALFAVFIPLVSYIDNRRKEREAFYKADTMRRLVEASGEGAQAALNLLREEEWVKAVKAREGLKIGGLINMGVGIGLAAMLYSMAGHSNAPWMVGLIPFLVGVALLVYVYGMAEPLNRP